MQTITDLLGESFTAEDPYGEDLAGDDLVSGYHQGRSVDYIPQVTAGDGLAGPPNEQQLQIYRDDRPLAVDELGMQGPFNLVGFGSIARHRAGNTYPLNYEWNAGLDLGLPGLVPAQDVLSGAPFGPDQAPEWGYGGTAPTELGPTARTVAYTASPNVGWSGY
jgi:hypothetical protein